MPVGYHIGQLLVGGASHAGDGVHAVGAAVRKGCDHVTQAFDVGTALGEGLQVGVVILPVGDLALQRGIDAARARCNDICGLVPKLILSGYALICRAVRLGVGLRKGGDLLLNVGDGWLKLLHLGSGLRSYVCVGGVGGSHQVYRLVRQLHFLLSIGDGLGILLHGGIEVFYLPLRLVNFVVVPVDSALQVTVLLGQGRIIIDGILVQLVHARHSVGTLFFRCVYSELCLRQLNTVFGLLHQDIIVLLGELVHVLLVCLSFRIFPPRLRVGAESGGTALNRTVLDVNQIGELWYQLAQQRQGISILLLLLIGELGIIPHLLQLCNILVSDIGSRYGLCSRILKRFPCLVHGIPHPLGRLGQLVHRGNGVIGGGGGKGGDGGGHAGHGRSYAHDDVHARDRGREQLHKGNDHFCDCGVCGKTGRSEAHDPHKGRHSIYKGRVLLDKFRDSIEHSCAYGVGFLERRGVGVADGHLQILVGILHHGQPALRGGIPLVGLVGEGGILLPRSIRGIYCAGHLVCGQAQSLEHIALPDASQPQVLQHEHGAFALLVQLAQTADEGGQGTHGIVLPCGGELIGGHTRDACELRKVIPALCNGLFNGVEGLGHGGTASLRLDAHGGHSRRQSHDLRLGQSGQLAGRR